MHAAILAVRMKERFVMIQEYVTRTDILVPSMQPKYMTWVAKTF